MKIKLAGLKKFLSFSPSSFFNRYFHSSRVALVALVVLASGLVAGSAVADSGFALIGYWSFTAADGSKYTMEMNPNGTITGQMVFPARATGAGDALVQYRGRYGATGASSFVFQVQSFQTCTMGGSGCQSCPGNSDVCGLARKFDLAVGVQQQRSYQMQGPNQFADQNGQRWRR